MNNVVDLNRFKANHHGKQVDYDPPLFFTGVFLTLVVPIAIYLAFRGPVPVIAFALTALTGVILGLIYYLYFPYQVISCTAGTGANQTPSTLNTTTPPTAGTTEKKAA